MALLLFPVCVVALQGRASHVHYMMQLLLFAAYHALHLVAALLNADGLHEELNHRLTTAAAGPSGPVQLEGAPTITCRQAPVTALI